MEDFRKLLQQNISVDFVIDYGCLGMGYTHILIIDSGKIKSIGCFTYSAWTKYSTESETIEAIIKLGEQAEKYRQGEREIAPCVLFWDNKIKCS